MNAFSDAELSDLVLTTERLALRPWQAEDAEAVYTAMQDRRMHEFLALPDPYTRADAESYVNRTPTGEFERALVETASGNVIGSAALRLPAHPNVGADIGYAVYPRGQGHGFAAEATTALAAAAFDRGIPRVSLRCAVTNLASAKSALNAGFRFEGYVRSDVRTPAGYVDGALFARLPGDPEGAVPRVFTPLPGGGLTDGVVRLRPMIEADAQRLVETEDEVTVANGFTGEPLSPEMAARDAARAGLDWLVGAAAGCSIIDEATGEVAGHVRLRLPGPPQVGLIGYSVHPSFRGRGYTTRALRLLSPWALGPGGFARLELGAKLENVASQKAALAAGFQPDGVREGRLRNPDGSFSDEARFALVNQTLRRIKP